MGRQTGPRNHSRNRIAPTHSAKPIERQLIERLESRTLLSAAAESALQHQHEQIGQILELPAPYAPRQIFLAKRGSYLSAPAAGDPAGIAMNYLLSNAGYLGLKPADIRSSIITDRYTDAHNGVTHIYLRQLYNGLEIANANMGIHVAGNGRVIGVGGAFVPGVGGKSFSVAPQLNASSALDHAANLLGLALSKPADVIEQSEGWNRKTHLRAPETSADDIPAELNYVLMPNGQLELAWDLVVRPPSGGHWYNTSVAADDGQVLFAVDWANDFTASYNVLPRPVESPQDGSRSLLVDPHDPLASPFGWHDTDGVVGAEFTDTRGNNVSAQDDTDANNTGGNRPSGVVSGSSDLLFDFPLDLSLAPSGYQSAAITNLFYWNNVLHDVHYRYGFTEAAGNFQINNYGKGGAGNDAVQADAQDGSGTNNANFATPADGSAPRMQMYNFTSTSPARDGDLANEIITHEYGHGVSNRLTGGPNTTGTLNATQSGGMGEGWSDFWALMFTQKSTDTQMMAYPQGNWVLGQTSSGIGIRRKPYSFDMSIDPLTFDAYGTSGSGGGVTRSTQVHNTGEIWCSTLWDMNWLLVNKYSFEPNIQNGYSPASPRGNTLALQLVMDGLKLQPSNPTFTQARDAILQADQVLTGGANQREIWTAFARRGLGFSAYAGSSASATSITVGFDIPLSLLEPSVLSHNPVMSVGLPIAALNLVFSEAIDPASFSPAADINSFTGPGGVDLLSQITGHAWSGDAKTLTINFTPQSTNGLYTLNLGPQILAADDAHAMNQDGDLSNGEPVQDAYTATFRFDALLGQVISTVPANGTNVLLPLSSIDFNFNEAFDPASVSASDLTLSQGTASGFSIVDADTIRFNLSGISGEGTLTLNIAAGAIADSAGNAMAAYSGSLSLDLGTVPFPVPLTARSSQGTLIYDGSATGVLGTNADVDSFTLLLDAPQTLTLRVDPAAALRALVEVRDPSNNLIGSAASAAAGKDAILQTVPITAAGLYTISVSSFGGAFSGSFSLNATLNAALELESYDGPANDTLGTAQDSNNAFFSPVAGSASMSIASVLGRAAGPTGGDPVYTEGFESGTLGSAWTTYKSSTNGRIQITNSQGAAAGSYAMLMDTSSGSTLNEAIWTVNLSGVVAPKLIFSTREFSDELTVLPTTFSGHANGDGVAISADGTNWRTVWSADAPNSWITITIDLAAIAAAAGIPLGANFRIKFQQYDDNPIPTDGRGYDAITVTTASSPLDHYSFTMLAGESVSVGAAPQGGLTGNMTIKLLDSAGTTVAEAIAGSSNFHRLLQGYIAPADGVYFVSVTTDNATDYALTVVKNGAIEREPNGPTSPQQVGTSTSVIGTLDGSEGSAPGNVGTPFVGARDFVGTPLSLGIANDGSFVGPTIGARWNGVEYLRYGTYLAGFTVGFNGGTYTNNIASNGATAFPVTLEDITIGTMHGVRVRGTIAGTVGFLRTIWWNEGDSYALVQSTLTNNSIASLSNVAMLDNQDPDPNSTTSTSNDRIVDGNGQLVLGTVAGSGGMGLGSMDPRAVASAEGFAITNPFDVINSPADPDGVSSDIALNMAFNLGSLAPGQSTTTTFAMVFGSTTTAIRSSYGAIAAATLATIGGGEDRYAVTLAAGEALILSTHTPGSGPGQFDNSLDPALRIYSPTEVLVASDDNSAPDGRNASLLFVAPAAGTYVIVVRSTAAADTRGEYILSLQSSAINLSLPTDVAENGGNHTGTLQLFPAPATELIVTLTSSDPTRLGVPSTILVPAGTSSIDLPITVIDNSLLDGASNIVITAGADGYAPRSTSIVLHDDETATLTITLPSAIAEGTGTVAGMITSSAAATQDIVITLVSNDPLLIGVPSTLTLPAGQVSVLFDVQVLNNTRIGGNGPVTISASVENWTDGVAMMNVVDDDAHLVVELPASGWETQTLNGAGTVRIGGTLTTNVVVDLLSSDTSELSVPATVTILAGQTTATFWLSLLSDALKDGTQSVQVTASAAGLTSGSGSIDVRDANLDHVSIDTITGPKTAAVPFAITARAHNLLDEVIAVYTSPAQFTASGQAGGLPMTPTSATFFAGVLNANVSVNAVDAAVALTVDVGGGINGTSNPFAVEPGPVARFQWESIASPQVTGIPFSVTITAKDAKDFTATGFNGIANLTGITAGGTIAISPTTATFVNGIWTGNVTVPQSTLNLLLGADDGASHVGQSNTFHVIQRTLTLTVPPDVREDDGAINAILNVSPSPSADLVVTLTNSKPSRLSAPAEVVIPAGQTSVLVPITILNNGTLDGLETAQLTASAATYAMGTGSIRVHDDESGVVSVTIPTSASESAGTIVGVISFNDPATIDISVQLTSSHPTRLSVPASVLMPAGQTSVNFDISLLQNTLIDGASIVSVQAGVDNWIGGGHSIVVTDDDNHLTVTLPTAVMWEGQTLANAGTVSIGGTLAQDLLVDLSSSDTSELTLPQTVVIPAGQTSVAFNLSLLTDGLTDGNQTVTVTASASGPFGITDGVAGAVVHDADPSFLTFDGIIGTKTAAVAFGTTARAKNADDELIVVFNGTAALSATGTGGATLPLNRTSVSFTAGVAATSISVNAVDAAVMLRLERGGIVGTSDSFAVEPGPIAGFQWEPVGAVQARNVPFNVTVTARDANGFIATGYSGPANLRGWTGSTLGTQILAFTGYADTSPNGEYQNTLKAISSLSTNYTVTTTTTTSASALQSALVGKHVFLVPEQENATGNTLFNLGTSWASTLTNFVNGGGMVIVCSDYNTESTILSASSLLSVSSNSSVSTALVTKTLDNALTAGLPASFIGNHIHEYNLATNGVVALMANGLNVVISRDINSGRVVLIGTDYETLGTEMDRVVANAVNWAHSGATPMSILPSATGSFVNGAWTGSIRVLDPGDDVYLRVDDGFGGHSAISNLISLTPNAPGAPILHSSTDTGISNSDRLTNRNNSKPEKYLQFTVTGLINGAGVGLYATDVFGNEVYIGGTTSTGTAMIITTDGYTALPEGSVLITARQSFAGLESPFSAASLITIDSEAPSSPIAPDLQTGSDSGLSYVDRVTNINTPLFDIFAAPYYRVYVDGVQVSGNYGTNPVFQAPVLADGTRQISVSRVDDAGNVSAPSANRTVVIDTLSPVISAEFEYQTHQRVVMSLSENLPGVTEASFDLLGLPGNTPVAKSLAGGSNSISYTFDSLLPDGNYRLLPGSGLLTDLAGNALAAWAFDFFVLAGDANRDRAVNLMDLIVLAPNWQQSGMTFSGGDFDYNGVVDSRDLGILSSNWQQRLDAPVAAAPPAPTAADRRNVRTPTRIADSVL